MKYEEMKIGQKIEMTSDYDSAKIGMVGTVKLVRAREHDVAIEFDKPFGGHGCNGVCKDGCGQYVPASCVRILQGARAVTHIVVWDIRGCGDPHEVFFDKKTAMEKVEKLIEDDKVYNDSIHLFEIAKEYEVKTSFKLKEIKATKTKK